MMYDKNLQTLKAHNERLYDILAAGDVKWDETAASVEQAKNGEPVLVYEKDGQRNFLNSKYNPSHEAERFMADCVDMAEESVLVMYGMSNMSYIRYFLEHSKHPVCCVIYEPSIDIFMRVMSELDIEDVISDDRVFLSVAGLNTDYFGAVLRRLIGIGNINTNKYMECPHYRELFSEQYDSFSEVIYNVNLGAQAEINTFAEYGPRVCNMTINNMRFFPGCRSGMDYAGIFPEDMPAVIVSAGPSLEKNVELLREVKGKALVVAVDRALPAIMSRGIRPDMVICIDFCKPLDMFDFPGLDETVFLATDSVNIEVLEFLKPKNLVFFSSDSLVWDSLFRKAGSEIQNVFSGGSVAISALCVLMSFGFRKIVLLGQDLAFSNGQQYANQDSMQTYEFTDNLYTYTKDIYGEDVLTTKDYLLYIHTFEDIAYNHPDLCLIDATEGGALIRNTQIMTFREVIDQYCTKEYDIDAIIKSPKRLFVGDDKELVATGYKDMKEHLLKLHDELMYASKRSAEGEKLLRTRKFNVNRLKKIYDTLEKVGDMLCEAEERTLLTMYASLEDYKFALDMYMVEDNHIEESVRMLEKNKNYYKALADAALVLIKIIEDCESKLQPEGQADDMNK